MRKRAGYWNSDVAKIIDVDPRQILHWTGQGLVLPSLEARGGGTKRRYDQVNLLELGVARDLLFVHGVGIQTVKRILQLARHESLLQDWLNNPTSFFAKQFEAGIFGYVPKRKKLSQYGTPEWEPMWDSLRRIFVDEPRREIEKGEPPYGLFVYLPRVGERNPSPSFSEANAHPDKQTAAGLRIAAYVNRISITGTVMILPRMTMTLREELLYGATFLYSQLSMVGYCISVNLQNILAEIRNGMERI